MKKGSIEAGSSGKRKRERPNRQKARRQKASNQNTHEKGERLDSNLSKIATIDGCDGGDDEAAASAKRRKPSCFLEKMRAKLSGGHFRMINEKLYTCTGSEALDYFKDDPALFNVYHTGYQEQMSHWPEQPVNIIIKWLQSRSPSLVVADFGCGDARLARNVKNKVFSFDLVSNDPSVIACDMSSTPIGSSSVDVVVFCLSLMGTNFASYLQEAHRVLKAGGWLLIAEVKSRFDPNTGGADPKSFINAVSELGFSTATKDFSNKMFILLYFKKKGKCTLNKEGINWPELKPCLYKRR